MGGLACVSAMSPQEHPVQPCLHGQGWGGGAGTEPPPNLELAPRVSKRSSFPERQAAAQRRRGCPGWRVSHALVPPSPRSQEERGTREALGVITRVRGTNGRAQRTTGTSEAASGRVKNLRSE